MHALPSVHGAVLFTCVQPLCASHTSVVQGLLSSHGATVPPVQRPPTHLSLSVHELPSSHARTLSVKTQPVAPSQLSFVQGLPSEHSSLAPGWHAPPAHASPTVHTLPSEHVAVVFACVHPLVGSHESAVHALLSSQFGAAPGTHWPLTHVSPTVHALLSLQLLPLTLNTQPSSGSHVSIEHGLPSSQGSFAPGTHAPLAQVSPVVQALPSEQGNALFVLTQPLTGSQASVVQGLASAQVGAPPGTH